MQLAPIYPRFIARASSENSRNDNVHHREYALAPGTTGDIGNNRNSMKIKLWVVATGAILVLASGGGVYAYSQMKAKQAAEKKAADAKIDKSLVLASVDFARAAPTVLSTTLSVSGTVDAAKQAMVRSRQSGIATQMTKRAGDAVKQGELLARVDSEELRLRIGEREAALTVAESARAQQRSLSDRGFISKAALDSVESNYIGAKSALESAQSQLSVAKTALADTALTAPISGVISKRAVEPGERVGNEMNVFQIIDPASLEIIVAVPAERVAELKIGQKATFQIDNGGRSIDATLARIIPTAGSAARTMETRFALPANSGIPAGAFLSGQLVLSQSDTPIAIPRVAVKTDVNGNYVWVVENNTAKTKRIKLAPSADTANALVPVAEGVNAGATVLTLRGAEPNEGQAVKMPEPPTATTPAAPTAASVSAPASKISK
jgi:membrane fusion protein, multidrug efflux system